MKSDGIDDLDWDKGMGMVFFPSPVSRGSIKDRHNKAKRKIPFQM